MISDVSNRLFLFYCNESFGGSVVFDYLIIHLDLDVCVTFLVLMLRRSYSLVPVEITFLELAITNVIILLRHFVDT